jgi:hypothetical protein
MKKILLIVSLLLVTTFCHSQSFNKVIKATFIKYVNGRWIDGESSYPDNMFIIMEGSEIKITNNVESKFVTYGECQKINNKDFTCYTWNCYDKKGNDCTFMMKKPYEGNTLVFMFIYSSINFGLEYVTE